jgi:hypothetical protein
MQPIARLVSTRGGSETALQGLCGAGGAAQGVQGVLALDCLTAQHGPAAVVTTLHLQRFVLDSSAGNLQVGFYQPGSATCQQPT